MKILTFPNYMYSFVWMAAGFVYFEWGCLKSFRFLRKSFRKLGFLTEKFIVPLQRQNLKAMKNYLKTLNFFGLNAPLARFLQRERERERERENMLIPL